MTQSKKTPTVANNGSAVTEDTAKMKEIVIALEQGLNKIPALLNLKNLSKEEHPKLWTEAIKSLLCFTGLYKEKHEKLWTEAYDKAVALLDYRVAMGKLILETEGAQGQRSDLAFDQSKVKVSKEDVYTELGLSRTQSDDYQKIAKNPSVVEAAKQKAIEKKCLPTVYLVKKLIAETEKSKSVSKQVSTHTKYRLIKEKNN